MDASFSLWPAWEFPEKVFHSAVLSQPSILYNRKRRLWVHVLVYIFQYFYYDGKQDWDSIHKSFPSEMMIKCNKKRHKNPGTSKAAWMPNEFGVCMVYGRCCTKYDGARQAWVSRHFCMWCWFRVLGFWCNSCDFILSGQIGWKEARGSLLARNTPSCRA